MGKIFMGTTIANFPSELLQRVAELGFIQECRIGDAIGWAVGGSWSGLTSSLANLEGDKLRQIEFGLTLHFILQDAHRLLIFHRTPFADETVGIEIGVALNQRT